VIDEFVICFHCGKKVVDNLKDGRPTWFGSYQNSELVQAVCSECYDNGVRTDIGKEIDRQEPTRN
jgi:hypothetical protein